MKRMATILPYLSLQLGSSTSDFTPRICPASIAQVVVNSGTPCNNQRLSDIARVWHMVAIGFGLERSTGIGLEWHNSNGHPSKGSTFLCDFNKAIHWSTCIQHQPTFLSIACDASSLGRFHRWVSQIEINRFSTVSFT
jgi:hypothetical protein